MATLLDHEGGEEDEEMFFHWWPQSWEISMLEIERWNAG